ncbi:hypothetical protein NPIL_53251 [Nephila pilipes]|uniref:Uncharacterized protein n=1 Tax=Nephila pilipes TaxID=299642 RepID=A0A8X6TCW5_NEPPI|nr:hypothetical protein NPIL_53251 [Nephila pilipes]
MDASLLHELKKVSSSTKELSTSFVPYENVETETCKNFNGYRMIDVSAFLKFCNDTSMCKHCQSLLILTELYSLFQVQYPRCDYSPNFQSCPMIGEKKKVPEINRMSILAMRSIGDGLPAKFAFPHITKDVQSHKH